MTRTTRLLGVLLICLAAVCFPLLVSVDGYNYISSADVLFSSDMSETYSWFREPGYPFFLKSIHGLFGSSDISLSLIQGASLAAGVLFSFKALHREGTALSKLSLLVLLIGFVNPVFLGYASMVFRQPLFTFLLCLLVLLISRYLTASATSTIRTFGIFFVLVLLGSSLSRMFVFVGLFPGAILLISWIHRRRKSSPGVNRWRIFALPISLMLCASLVVLISWFGWQSASNELEKTSDKKAEGVFSLSGALESAFQLGPVGFAKQFVFMTRSTLMLGPTDNAGGLSENQLWSDWQLDPNNLCGAWDGVYGEEAENAKFYLSSSCRSFYGQRIMSALKEPGLLYYRMCSICFLLFPLYLTFRRQWKSLIVFSIPLWFLILHAARDYSNDRYGIPLYPFGLIAFVIMMQDGISWISTIGGAKWRLRGRLSHFRIRCWNKTPNEADPITPVADCDRTENSGVEPPSATSNPTAS
jgi:hypothetical protein